MSDAIRSERFQLLGDSFGLFSLLIQQVRGLMRYRSHIADAFLDSL
jgi:hypothetical protein